MNTTLSSGTKDAIIGQNKTILIGERINPAGKKKLAESLRAGSMDVVKAEAIAQTKAGADMLDINVGTSGVDEVVTLPLAVKTVMEVSDLPICIDSANAAALEQALKVYKGKALLNSVTGEEKSLSRILPLVKEYGASVVGLVQDDEGIPKESSKRVAVALKIIERAEKMGIKREDIIIDCLTLSISAEANSGNLVLETIRRLKLDYGINTVLGISNISFGLPDRAVINNTFISMAIAAGLNCIITDVEKVRTVVLAADLLLGRDRFARRYLTDFRQRQPPVIP